MPDESVTKHPLTSQVANYGNLVLKEKGPGLYEKN